MATKKNKAAELNGIGLLTVGTKNPCGGTLEHITIRALDGSIVAWVNCFQSSFNDGKDRVYAGLLAEAPAMLRALQKIAAIRNKPTGLDWQEIADARLIAREAIAAAKGKR